MDRKLSEEELRSLLERTGFNELTFVTVMKVSGRTSSALTADIDKHYKDFKDKLTGAKDSARHKEDYTDKEYYDTVNAFIFYYSLFGQLFTQFTFISSLQNPIHIMP